jgi:putative hemolysin
MEIFIIIGLALVNGIFSMSEMALVSSRRFKLENAKKKGNKGAEIALELTENPTKFLSTVQIGITLIGILLGVYGGEKLINDISTFLGFYALVAPYAKSVATAIVVVSITYVSIVLGELLPKRIGMTFPEPIAIALAPAMKILSVVTSPFVWLLTATNNIILNLLGIKKTIDSKVSEEEIKSIIKESADGGEIQDIEQNIVERVFELGDRKVKSLLTHRNELTYFTTSDTFDEVKQKIDADKHSAYPVCTSDDLDDVIGIVLLKDLFAPIDPLNFDIKAFIKKPVFLNENTDAYMVLEFFKKEKIHYGIVVDEFGTTLGMVTMDDVLDALVGHSTETDQDEYEIVERTENTWLVDGQFSAVEFLKYFDIQMEENTESKFSTVAGLVIYQTDTIPEVGAKFDLDRYTMEVIDKDGQRIDKILVTKN